MQKKLLVILFLLILILGSCTGCVPGVIPEPNEPDPQPNTTPTTSNRVVMVELFVAPACTHCPKAKADIARLLEEYGLDKIIVLEEYAWNTPLPFSSGWATPETINRYTMYTSDTATPDAYFNGLNQSVHQDDSGYNNYKNAIDEELEKPVQISISTSAVKDSSIKSINITGNIKNIGNNTFSNIIIGAMVYEDSVPLIVPDKPTYTANHVVRDILTHVQVSSLSSEETYGFSFTADSEDLKYVDNFNNLHIVVFVQAPYSSAKEILQASYIE